MTFYNLKTALDDYRITKFTTDLEVESSYIISHSFDQAGRRVVECECPAGTRPTCRHRQMFSDLIPIVDTEFFWDFERHMSVDANGNPSRVTVAEPALEPHSPTATTPDFDSGDGGSTPPAVASTNPARVTLPSATWRRI